MINVSNDCYTIMQTRTDFKEYATVTLASGTVLNLDPSDFTINNNVITDGSGSDGFPFGFAIEKLIQMEIANVNGEYDNYSFDNAVILLSLKIPLTGSSVETIQKGKYTVLEPVVYGETISLVAADDMYKADRFVSTTISFPITLGNLLSTICTATDIYLASSTFTNSTLSMTQFADDISQYTYRQLIGMIAQFAGGNARISATPVTVSGQTKYSLQILPYSLSTLSSMRTAVANNTVTDSGRNLLENWQSVSTATEDITITGIETTLTSNQIIQDDEEEEQEEIETTILVGDEGYVLTLTNPFLTSDNAETLMTNMGNLIIGCQLRPFTGTYIANPTLEFMDPVYLRTRRGATYVSVLTDVSYTVLGTTELSNSSTAKSKNGPVYVSAASSAQNHANQAISDSVAAAQAAAIAQSSATTAASNAATALENASLAQGAAQQAIADADTAHREAVAASASAASASASAIAANNYANNALTQLSFVEDVAGTIDWIQKNGRFTVTSDTTVQEGTAYFIYNSSTQDYEPIVNPDRTKNPHNEGWYVLDVTDSQTEFILAHLAVTTRGLWVLPSGLPSTNKTIDNNTDKSSNSDTQAQKQENANARQADNYKVLLSNNGMYIYDGTGALVTTYGESITFSSTRAQSIGNQNAYIVFNPANNGSITIGGAVTFGSSKTLTEVLNELNSIPTDVSQLTDTTGVVPTATSDLTNDSGYQTSSEVSSAISTATAGLLTSVSAKDQYYLSTSSSNAEGGTWQDTVPTWSSGKYIWTRVATTKTNSSGSTTTYSTAVYDKALTGALSDILTKADSTAAASTVVTTQQYYLSTSSSTKSGGSWSNSQPAWTSGKYIWTRFEIVTTPVSGSATTTYSPNADGVYDSTLTTALQTAVDSAKTATTYIAEINNDGIFVHQNDTNKNGATPSASNAYGVHISDDVDIIRAGVSVASYGESARIGKENETRAEISSHSLVLKNGTGTGRVYFKVEDLKDDNGDYSLTEEFKGNGIDSFFPLSFTAKNTSYTVTVSDSSGGTVTKQTTAVLFSTAPTSGATITVSYVTTSNDTVAFTFGSRLYNSFIGAMSFASGIGVTASGTYSHAEGISTTASGFEGSHAEGALTVASGLAAHAQNHETIAAGDYQTAIGSYNIEDTNNQYAFIIGNGTSDSNRSNAYTVDWSGDVFLALNTSAPSVTDYDLYSAITALGWGSEVIV